MKYCPGCRHNLNTLKKYCSDCGNELVTEKQFNIDHTGGDAFGIGFSGSGNVVAKDTKGNIINFHIGTISPEYLKDILIFLKKFDISLSDNTSENNNEDLKMIKEFKRQTSVFLNEINRMEKKEGNEIQELNYGDTHLSKNEILIKEIIIKGEEYYFLKEYDRAIECYDKAVKINAVEKYAWNGKGMALNKLGDYEQSLECHDKAVKIDPEYAKAWNDKGEVLIKLGNYEQAVICFDEALRLDPEYTLALYNKNWALEMLKKSGWRRFF